MLDKINATMLGSGITGGLVLFIVALVWGGMTDNTNAISEIKIDVVKVDSTLKNIDNSLEGLDKKYYNLDEKTDKMILILCDLSNGKHCN